jgi:transcription termination factor Rho
MAKKRRRRKKGGGGGGNSNSATVMTLQPGEVPTDEQLEVEAKALEKELDAKAQKKFDDAKKDGFDLASLQALSGSELAVIGKKEKITDASSLSKQKLVFEILKSRAEKHGLMMGEGTLEIMSDGFGFLRSPEYSYVGSPDDVYVSPSQIRRFGLRRGQIIRGVIRPPKESEVYFALLRVDSINGLDPKKVTNLPVFENMTPLHPEDRVMLETGSEPLETRVIDLVAPLGFGQRALIVAPPRTGKTVLLRRSPRRSRPTTTT